MPKTQPALSNSRAIAELSFAAALWGFGFIAAVWGLESLDYFTLTATRFVIAFIAASIWALALGVRGDLLSRQQFLLAFWPGLFLSLTLILQTWGLAYTTATRSGFITCLYILFVPILEAFYLKKRLSRWHFLFVTLALVGTALICNIQIWPSDQSQSLGLSHWNKGDLITLLCTFTASAQIASFGVIGSRIGSPVAFNALQSFWAMLLPLVLAFAFDHFPILPAITTHAWIGILSLGIGSSTFAFMLQIRAQKQISPSTASMLFLLESPFALIFAILFLHEKLSGLQWAGAAIVMLAVILSTRVDTERGTGLPASPPATLNS